LQSSLGPLVLCVHGSPRRNGNTDLLLDALAEGVVREGGRVERVDVRRLPIQGCSGCGACETTGRCSVRDPMQEIYGLADAADALAVAAPVYFLGLPGQLKAFVDRFQCRWSRKYLLNEPPPPPRPGAFLATAGAPARSVFTCSQRSVEALFDVLGVVCGASLCYEGVDERGAIRAHPEALTTARRLGGELVERCRGVAS